MTRLIDDIIELARIPAPTFEEGARIEWLERRLAHAPGQRIRDDVGNLVWTWDERRPRLLVAAHVDTVFGTDTPIDIEQRDGYLVGPGVGDNAAAVAVALTVIEQALARASFFLERLYSRSARKGWETFAVPTQCARRFDPRPSSLSRATSSIVCWSMQSGASARASPCAVRAATHG